VTAAPRGAHLPGLVAELRSVACASTASAASASERQGAAAELARLAQADVAGADPDHGWGLADASIDGPLAEVGKPTRISPSRVESFAACELRDVLRAVGGRDGDAVSASLGSLVHDVAAAAPPGADLAEFERLLDQRWAELDFGAAWFAANERGRAREILQRLVEWLRASRSELTLVDVERDFDVVSGDVHLVGRVDRLERDRQDRLVVIDLKTGKSKPAAAELPRHPQLAAYQLAVSLGAFNGENAAQGDVAGGARLVQLAAAGGEQRQPPLAEDEEPGWIAQTLSEMALRLRGSTFTAEAGPQCTTCDVRLCCPLVPGGQQVTG
jgi:RecB family exonuclease